MPARDYAVRTLIKRGVRISGKVADIAPVNAEVNHGRWIVRCPFCTGAELADAAEPLFVCLSCGNASIGGDFVPVRFPRDRFEIESTLLERPDEETRNWLPSETVRKLRDENRDRLGIVIARR